MEMFCRTISRSLIMLQPASLESTQGEEHPGQKVQQGQKACEGPRDYSTKAQNWLDITRKEHKTIPFKPLNTNQTPQEWLDIEVHLIKECVNEKGHQGLYNALKKLQSGKGLDIQQKYNTYRWCFGAHVGDGPASPPVANR